MPRRVGGKYKGKIGREKGEETLAQEAEEKKRIATEKRLAELAEKRAADAGLGNAVDRRAEEEARRQRIANLLMGGGRGALLKKYFGNWKIGKEKVKKEKADYIRMTCWRKSCEYCIPTQGCPAGCSCHRKLHDVEFGMPYDFRLGELVGSRSGFRVSTAGSSRPSTTQPKPILRTSSAPALPQITVSTLGNTNARSLMPIAPRKNYTEEVYHAASGRRCLLDITTSSIIYADAGSTANLRSRYDVEDGANEEESLTKWIENYGKNSYKSGSQLAISYSAFDIAKPIESVI